MIGRTLDGFRIVALLGRGGMGEVWKAEQATLGNRPVALKLLRGDRAESASALERLKREGAMIARLRHPGIAQVYAAGAADGEHYVAMEFVEGESLSRILARGPLALPEARRIALAVADALAHAHDRGVLHRDVTPNNIMIDPAGRVVLLDFGLGLALDQSRVTTDGAVLGTAHYVAPEVLRRFEPDARSDVYSLGVVFYRLLAGATPFEGERREQVEFSVLHDAPDPPSRRCPGLDAGWDNVALLAIAREPGLRFGSARAFAQALEGLEASEPARPADHVDTRQSTQELAAPPVHGSAIPRCVAVMPFTAPGGSPEAIELAAGFAQAIGAALTRFPALRVVPPLATALASRESPQAVVRDFGADLVLGGTLQQSGNRLRVTWSLMRGADPTRARAGLVEGVAGEPFELQDRVVRDLAVALGVTTPASASGDTASDPAHHERYLQAMGYLQRFDSEASVDGAVALLEQLTRDPAASADAWSALAHAYRQKHAHTNDRAWLDRALQAGLQAVALAPESAETLAALARVHALLGRQQEAEAGYRRALELNPSHTRALIGLVDLHRTRGRLAEAESACRRAIAIRPDYWGGHNGLGAIFFQAGRWDDAVASWREVVRLTPDNPRGWCNIGAAHFQAGRLDEARQAYERSLELSPTAAAYAGLGTLRFYAGDAQGARDVFERAVVLRPNDAVMWANLGDACRLLPAGEERATETFAAAVRIARERLEVNPRDVNLRGALAGWLSRLGDLDAAINVMGIALEMEPDNARNAARAVTVYELAGMREQALRQLHRALALGIGWVEFDRAPDLAQLRSSTEVRDLRRKYTSEAGPGAPAAMHDPRPGGEG